VTIGETPAPCAPAAGDAPEIEFPAYLNKMGWRKGCRPFANIPNTIMPEPTVAQKFPYVQDAKPGTNYWCSCGQSKSQPFCDGSHKGTAFSPVKVDIATEKKIAWCGCKHSKAGAFCDGSHKHL